MPTFGFKEVLGFKTNTYVMRSSWLPRVSVSASLHRSSVPSYVVIQHPLGFSSSGSCPHWKACFPEVEDTCPHSWLPEKMECRCVTSLLQSFRAREPSIYKNNMKNPFVVRTVARVSGAWEQPWEKLRSPGAGSMARATIWAWAFPGQVVTVAWILSLASIWHSLVLWRTCEPCNCLQ